MTITEDHDLVLPDQDGRSVSLAQTLVAQAGTVLLSHRGHW